MECKFTIIESLGIPSLFVVMLMIITSCSEHQKPIQYEIAMVDSTNPSDATLRKIETEIEFGNPSTIDFISDSLMVIYDTNVNDYVAHIVDTKGHHINSFGRKGRGEGELISPINISISEGNDSAFIYDFMLQRMVGFDLNRVIKKQEQQPSVFEFDINSIPNQEYRFTHVKSGPNGSMLGFSSSTNRIVSMKDGNVQYTYSEYPQVDPDTETNWSIWNYTGDLDDLSPDKTKLVVATYIGSLFETFELADESITPKVVKGFYRPTYQYAEGAVPKCVTPDPEINIRGFRSVSAGNDDFVAVMDGYKSQRVNEILKFDYYGNLNERIIVNNGWINRVGRNEKGEIYCFAYDNDFKNMNLYYVEQ